MLSENPDLAKMIKCAHHSSRPEYRSLFRRIFRRYDLSIVSQLGDRAHIYGFMAARHRIGILPENPLHSWWRRLICVQTITLNYEIQYVVSERFNPLEAYDPIASRTPEGVTPSNQPIPPLIRSDIQSHYIAMNKMSK